MNVCGGGVCVCQGGSDVIGEDSSCEDSRRSWSELSTTQTWTRRLYYFDKVQGVVFSVDDPSPAEIALGGMYEDPNLTIPYSKDK